MKTCIYCTETNLAKFKGVEHLIPKSFGTFSSETPTLKCVCDDCNAFFARDLDQVIARDSWEGVNRYKKGIKSREQRPISRLKFSIEKIPEMGGFGGAVFDGIDSTTGKLLPIRSQLHIKNNVTNEFDVFFIDEIKNIRLNSEIYGLNGTRKVKIIASSEEEHLLAVGELKKVGINYENPEMFSLPFIELENNEEVIELPIWVEGKIDHPVKRALVKILINFSAYYIGEDEVTRPEWNNARNYVRLNSEPILSKADTKPFWGEETDTMRLAGDSFNIIVENDGKNVIGKIQIYNFYTYTFILAENHNVLTEKAMRFTKGEKPFLAEKRLKK